MRRNLFFVFFIFWFAAANAQNQSLAADATQREAVCKDPEAYLQLRLLDENTLEPIQFQSFYLPASNDTFKAGFGGIIPTKIKSANSDTLTLRVKNWSKFESTDFFYHSRQYAIWWLIDKAFIDHHSVRFEDRNSK